MKITIGIFVGFLIILDILAYYNLKKFLKKHENETVEDNLKGLLNRVVFMIVISLSIVVLGVSTQKEVKRMEIWTVSSK